MKFLPHSSLFNIILNTNQTNNLSKSTAIIILVVILAISIAFVFFNLLKRESNSDTNQISNINSSITKSVEYAFSDSEYILEIRTYVNGEQSLIMQNRTEGTSREIGLSGIVGLNDINRKYSSFVWNENQTRLYFLSIISEWNHMAFLYIDINDPDPFATTEIVYEDPDNILSKDTIIEKVEDEILFLIVDGQRYTLNPYFGVEARPELIS